MDETLWQYDATCPRCGASAIILHTEKKKRIKTGCDNCRAVFFAPIDMEKI